MVADAEADSRSEFKDKMAIEIPNDLLYEIFIKLPAEILYKLQFQCKQWFSLINNSNFVETHARQSQTIMLLHKELCHLSESDTRFFFHSRKLEDGSESFMESSFESQVMKSSYKIRASCDGLIVVTSSSTWKIMNPVTRKQMEIPTSTSAEAHRHHVSFGMAFCSKAKTYKVVLLFRNGCEILNISSRVWRTIQVPKEPKEVVAYWINPVCIGGSLHWITLSDQQQVVSFNVCDEKFLATKLPVRLTNIQDTLVEMGENLGYVSVSYANLNTSMHVWILRECWIKVHNIGVSDFYVPICFRRNEREILLVRKKDDCFYAYNFATDEVKLVSLYSSGTASMGLLHRNTLISFDHMV